MGRPATKTDLLTAANTNFEKLNTLISGLTEQELTTPFDFSGDMKKKEAHWKRDLNLRDILICISLVTKDVEHFFKCFSAI